MELINYGKNIARYPIWSEENGKGKRPVIGGVCMYV
jgi:hypothetical protein